MDVPQEPLLLTVDETCKALGLGRSNVYGLIAKGVIPSVRIGSSVRVPVDRLMQWIRSMESSQSAS